MSEKFDVWKVDYYLDKNEIYVGKFLNGVTTADLIDNIIEDGQVFYYPRMVRYSTYVFYSCDEETKKEIAIAAIGMSNISAHTMDSMKEALSNYIEENR